MEAEGQVQAGVPDPCVLLGGQPRSGTTLLTSILRCTPGLFQAFEIHLRKPSFVVGLDGRYTRNIFKELGLPPEEYDRLRAESDESGMNLGAWVGPKEDVSAEPHSGRETDDFTGELRARARFVTTLMRRVAALHDEPRWGFKILGDVIHADHYAAAWPGATFILLVRDPRDQALSILRLNEQREARGQQMFYDDYRAAAEGWCRTITGARRTVAAHGLRCVEVRYEDLVTETDATIARLSATLDLDLSRGLHFQNEQFIDAHTQRFGHHDNLRQSVNSASVGKWRRQLTPAEIEVFREVGGPLMESLGYA